jgi:uncharacterized RDD family membrane protein YckC/predicted Ser/Thr protein kinase
MYAGDLEPGDRISEYVLEERVGRGGFGDVWRARHHLWRDRVVAVKVPADAEKARVLRNEGALQEIVRHENAVLVLGADADHDPPYLVMEFVDGESLRARLDRAGRLEPAEALRVAREVLSALAAAHERGVVHGDLKPENVLLGKDGKAKIADFGLGRLREKERQRLALSGGLAASEARTIEGTLAYMAPEQREPGRPIDARADIYAFGILLFEMLVGRRPEGIESPCEALPGLDPRIDALFARCYCRLERRFSDARGALEALDEVERKRAFPWAALEPLEGARGPGGPLPAWIGVPRGPITIGDSSEAHLWLAGRGIARAHASIEHRDGAFWIRSGGGGAQVWLVPAAAPAGARPEDHAVKVGAARKRLGEGVVIVLGPLGGPAARLRFHDGSPAPEPGVPPFAPRDGEPAGRIVVLCASFALAALALLGAFEGQVLVMAVLGVAALAAFQAAGTGGDTARPRPLATAPRLRPCVPIAAAAPAGIAVRALAFAIDLSLFAFILRRPWLFPVLFLYDWIATGLFGATVGKWLVGIRVVREDGVPIGPGAAFVRTLGKLLSVLPLGFGFLIAAFSPAKRALHDFLADSRVVREEPPGD